MQAYWPFHKTECRRNEFADIIEESEPKFSRWMRNHGKMAVLKDDEVDRLERASKATSGLSRQEVMDSMYGRLEPKPRQPSYSAEERIAMRRREEEEREAASKMALLPSAYLAIDLPKDMGMSCGAYKWRQSQSHVEVFVPIPDGVPSSKAAVSLSTNRISIEFDEKPILKGTLYRAIKAEESTWYIQDNVLEVIMLKRCRRGHYEKGKTNADTFWMSVLKSAPEGETLPLASPPLAYYWSHHEELEEQKRLEKSRNRTRVGALQSKDEIKMVEGSTTAEQFLPRVEH